MFCRTARIVALALPVLLLCLLVVAGGWRFHDGRVERVGHDSTAVAAPVASPQPASTAPPAEQVTFIRHLTPSVPWPACAGLVALCVLPAVASMMAWSGARRSRDAAFSVSGGST